ncbi:hypothetical protein I6A84_13585 [Frankia sp. CNm7]|uniref:Uncharacterized protein n=1 Tax=Frankia nepalensis TaxID=1836974 RepID=A0A937RHI3_9ACTN|nr:hypothetical protein [Frankia nepalensis]MBL7496941.1 hypothetical protein [Frankia nepalensis]MBL7513431.1 hypothetical protein [Frankia nepalensis]MBL7519110.1 hypothetical protein [Frankia nepalensis]MBL7626126.1 hypothetical protein [Frankia nepalensis]
MTIPSGKYLPPRLPVGSDAVDAVLAHLDAVRADIGAWQTRARDTAFGPAATDTPRGA